MLTASSTDVKNHFGEYLEKALQQPVAITKTGRTSAVILSITEYNRMLQRLEELEDQHWGILALEAEKSGFVGAEATQAFLNEMNEAHGNT